ncbi:nucleoside phosphorylase domain-containing protein [Podospora fimiseda]|uniref:Nucleoside phosphorylase domain-containing protein n=1 Tax=Podospora fimiseda TaxID=252190 RepID=A0AAN7BSR0_9PEZI|nr:nucleoside phosphorylase domain-containing protein [Podospora fimiseda]
MLLVEAPSINARCDPAQSYTVAWICPTPTSLTATKLILTKLHGRPQKTNNPSDSTIYTLGEIYGHNVVIATLPFNQQHGIAPAAEVVTNLTFTFPNVKFGLLVGTASAVPIQGKKQVYLGDIVVMKGDGIKHCGVLQYDYGKDVQGQRFQKTHFLNGAPRILQSGITQLVSWDCRGTKGLAEDIENQIRHKLRTVDDLEVQMRFSRPAPDKDRLFRAEIEHKSGSEGCGLRCDQDSIYDYGKLVHRDPPESLSIHYGLIGSGNKLIRNALERDRLAQEGDDAPYLCFETEAAGVMNKLPCLVVRGISNYADSHGDEDDEVWEPYAALVAAVYGSALLSRITPSEIQKGCGCS